MGRIGNNEGTDETAEREERGKSGGDEGGLYETWEIQAAAFDQSNLRS
jgi:hypothetical protein